MNGGGTSPLSNEAWARPEPNITIGICDITHDATVGVADVQAIVNQAFGMATTANDLNADGVVNVVDVQIVINAALGLGCSGTT